MSDKRKFHFRGLMAPVFTPFHPDKTVNLELVPQYADFLHSKGIRGVLVNGTTGEGVSMTQEERKACLAAWLRAAGVYGMTVVAQVGGTDMQDVKALARDAQDNGASAILCLADLFFRPRSVDQLVRYLRAVSAAAPEIPLLYYHVPAFTGIDLNMKELMERSEEIPTFAGIKFTDNDLVVGGNCVSEPFRQKAAVFLGSDSLLLSALFIGFDSAIGTTVNMFPDLNNAIFRCFRKKRFEEAARAQNVLNHNINQITSSGCWVSSMKEAMRQLTPIDVGPVREPLQNVQFSQPLHLLHL